MTRRLWGTIGGDDLARCIDKADRHIAHTRGYANVGNVHDAKRIEANPTQHRTFQTCAYVAELAVANYIGAEYDWDNYDRRDYDVAGYLEVKANVTTSVTTPSRLILRGNDKAGAPVVLVRTTPIWPDGNQDKPLAAVCFGLVGWAWVDDVRVPEYRRDDCWQMPLYRLEPIKTIPTKETAR